MPYIFSGFFACPAVPRPKILPDGTVWREITAPFDGIGIRLPNIDPNDDASDPERYLDLARTFGIDTADRWIYLYYLCWGGDVDCVFGLGVRDGIPFGPLLESDLEKAESAYLGLMGSFGISADEASYFAPFVRGFWGEA